MRGARASVLVAVVSAVAACRTPDPSAPDALADLARGLGAGAGRAAAAAGPPVCVESGPRRWAWRRAAFAREAVCRQALADGGQLQVHLAPDGRVTHLDRAWGAAAPAASAARRDSLARALGALAARRGGRELVCEPSVLAAGRRAWALASGGAAEAMVRADSASGAVRLEAVAGAYRACHAGPTA